MKNASRTVKQLGRRRRAQVRFVLELIRSLQSTEQKIRSPAIDTLDCEAMANVVALPICVTFGFRRRNKRIVHHLLSGIERMDLAQNSAEDLRRLCVLLKRVVRALPEERGFARRRRQVMRTFFALDKARVQRIRADGEAEKKREGSQKNIDAHLDRWRIWKDNDPKDCLMSVAEFAGSKDQHPRVRAAAMAFITRDAEELLGSSEARAYFYVELETISCKEREDEEVNSILSAMVQIVLCTPVEERVEDWSDEMLPFAKALLDGRSGDNGRQAHSYLKSLLE